MNSTEESINRILDQIEERERRSRQRTVIYTLIPICVAILVIMFIGLSIRQYQTQLEEIKSNSNTIQEKVNSLQNQLDAKTDQLNETQNTLKLAEQQLDQSKQDLQKANADLRIAQANVEDLQNQAEDYQKQIVTLQAQLDELNKALEQAEQSFSELTSLERYKYLQINNAYSYLNNAYPQQGEILHMIIYELGDVNWKYGGSSPEDGFDSAGLASFVLGNFGLISEPAASAQNNLGALLPITEDPIVGDLILYKLGYYMFYFMDEQGQPFVVGMTPFGILPLRYDFNPVERIYRVSNNLATCDQSQPPCRYTVRGGDTFSEIAQRFYGSIAQAPLIMNWNRDQDGYRIRLVPGDELLVPKLGTDELPGYPQCGTGEFPCLYAAHLGETYQSIAEVIYGVSSAESDIKNVNWYWDPELKIIINPPLEEGAVLVLPRRR